MVRFAPHRPLHLPLVLLPGLILSHLIAKPIRSRPLLSSLSHHIGRRSHQVDRGSRQVAIRGREARLDRGRIEPVRLRHVVVQLVVEIGAHGVRVDDEGALGQAGRGWKLAWLVFWIVM